VRRVSVAGISGSGKSTFGRALAERLGVPYVELDALFHGPNWTQTPAEEMRARVETAIATAPDGWVIDGNYRDVERLGDLVLGQADTLVWLDLPLTVSMARLARRTWRRLRTREELWSGNREQVRNLVGPREGLFAWAVRSYFRHRREVPVAVARNPHLRVVHLHTPREVDEFLARLSV
jgi:adenylate kinase family enzyme